jgi:hypothetical protein
LKGNHPGTIPANKHNDELFGMCDRIFYELWTFADFDRLCKLEKRGDEIFKKSSPLKLLSQSQPIFAEMILVSNWFQTRRFLCEFPIGSYVKLS